MNIRHYAMWCGLLALFALPVTAAPVIELHGQALHQPLNSYVDVLDDPSAQLTLADINTPYYLKRFAPAPTGKLSFGFTPSAVWLRFAVQNTASNVADMVLDLSPADIEHIDLYEVDPMTDAILSHKSSGTSVRWSEREYASPLHYFDMQLPAASSRVYFLRLQSAKALSVDLALNSLHKHLSVSGTRDWWQGWITGSLALLLLIYGTVFLLYRAPVFLYYALFVMGMLVVQVVRNGYIELIIHDDWFGIYRLMIVAALFGSAANLCFTGSFLRAASYFPLCARLLCYSGYLSLAMIVVCVFAGPVIGIILCGLLLLAGVFVCLGTTLHAYFEGSAAALQLLAVRSATLIISLIAIFSLAGLLPYSFVNEWALATVIATEGWMLLWLMIRSEQTVQIHVADMEPVAARVEPSSSELETERLGDFCHRLRTPISGVMGVSELLLDSSLTAQQRVHIEAILRSGEALLDVVNRMSDLSSIGSGKMVLHDDLFEIPDMIEICMAKCRARAESQNVELTYQIDENVPSYVKADQDKLQQAIISLIEYLIHQGGGDIVVSVACRNHDTFMFALTSGRNPLGQTKVFTRFEQAEPLLESQNLNLRVAQRYLELLGGEIRYVSEGRVGGLTLFVRVTLAVQGSGKVLGEDADILRNRLMMVVDDNDTCCRVVQQQASQWGMRVITANSGREALAIMRTKVNLGEKFDIALVDYDMPGMNGVELIGRICQDDVLAGSLPHFVMLTGINRSVDEVQAMEAAIDRVLYKPISGKSLKLALAELLLNKV